MASWRTSSEIPCQVLYVPPRRTELFIVMIMCNKDEEARKLKEQHKESKEREAREKE